MSKEISGQTYISNWDEFLSYISSYISQLKKDNDEPVNLTDVNFDFQFEFSIDCSPSDS